MGAEGVLERRLLLWRPVGGELGAGAAPFGQPCRIDFHLTPAQDSPAELALGTGDVTVREI